MMRFLQQPALASPNLHQAELLRRLVSASVPGSIEDLAVAYFSNAARAGFLSSEEAAVAVAEFREQKPAWREALLQETDRICRVGLPVYSTMAGPLTGGLDWSALPVGVRNDRLYRLRPHRFGFLPRLAIAASLGADTLPAMLATLERWIAHVASSDGAADAYFSNLVVICRVLAISWAVPFVVHLAHRGDRAAATICLQLFRILAADIHYLGPRIGRSVANNHLLADRFVAWFAAACHPGLCPQRDLAELECAWLAELGRQFQADGTNFEQSVHYHELGCEMALAYLAISLRIGASIPAPALSLVSRIVRFQAALADERGNGFALGDATDDPLLPLDAAAGSAGGAWRVLYRVLFDATFPPTDDGARGAERAFWLRMAMRNIACPLRLPAAPMPVGGLEAFPVNGYVVFRDCPGRQQVLFRTGMQPGATTSPGHAMSDLLSVYWNACGRPLLEPSGTYSYAADGEAGTSGPTHARSYFRGPAAHNGLVLRGYDPLGEAKARFRETDSDTRVATHWNSLEGVLGWAEGKMEARGPLDGYRRGVICVPGRYAIVYDLLPATPAGADIACHWQFAPEADVTVRQDKRATIRFDDFDAYFCSSDDVVSPAAFRGQNDPPAGWVSRRYGEIEPAAQLICRLEAGTRKVAFIFGPAEMGEDPPRLQMLEAGEGSAILEIRRGESCDIVVVGGYAGSLADQACDIEVRGQVLWLGFEEKRCIEMRALGLRHLSSEILGLEIDAGGSSATQGNWSTLAREGGTSGLNGQWRRVGRD